MHKEVKDRLNRLERADSLEHCRGMFKNFWDALGPTFYSLEDWRSLAEGCLDHRRRVTDAELLQILPGTPSR
ncbi:MAG: hypothetical protein K9L68_12985 [Spirochaetales bacterium]|nr:hypothetical protein [Spirochaetales bacterium]